MVLSLPEIVRLVASLAIVSHPELDEGARGTVDQILDNQRPFRKLLLSVPCSYSSINGNCEAVSPTFFRKPVKGPGFAADAREV
jgi:hypothetical protein